MASTALRETLSFLALLLPFCQRLMPLLVVLQSRTDWRLKKLGKKEGHSRSSWPSSRRQEASHGRLSAR